MNFRLLTILTALCLLAISCRGATNDIASDLTHLVPAPVVKKKAVKPKPKGAAALMNLKPMFPTLPPLPTFRSVIVAPLTNFNVSWVPESPPVAFRAYQGIAPGQYTLTAQVGNATNVVMPKLRGTNYFAVRAIDAQGRESGFSNEFATNGLPIPRTNVLNLWWQTSNNGTTWVDQIRIAGPFTNGIPGPNMFFKAILGRTSTNDNLFVQQSAVPDFRSPFGSQPAQVGMLMGTNRMHRLAWGRTVLQ